MISEAEQRDIMAAVARAEAETEGEIVCVFARQISHYPEVSIAAGAFAALVIPQVAFALGLHPSTLLQQALALAGEAGAWWTVHPEREAEVSMVLDGYGVAQAVLFTLGASLATIPFIRRALTPASLKRHRVHKAAWAQFAATGLHVSGGPTGVVIFASLDDRMVEILASEGIHSQVGGKVWDQAVASVRSGMKSRTPVKGFVRAVEICGAALAQHFPSRGARPNGLSDRLLEL